ncbi:MAG: hypothetical protein K2G91_10245, partial [Prevotella sp.]|nr:hypothetical protein [Prevotella sp.]
LIIKCRPFDNQFFCTPHLIIFWSVKDNQNRYLQKTSLWLNEVKDNAARKRAALSIRNCLFDKSSQAIS